MIITKMALPRRTFLRGVGATLALPLLDSMVPALSASARAAGGSVSRLYVGYVPNGVIMDQWTPSAEGDGIDLPQTLAPLAPYRDKVTVVTGLASEPMFPLPGEGTGDHVRAAAAFLTGVHPKKTEGPDIRGGTSMDQIAAAQIGQDTQLTSLELSLDPNELIGACEAGWSCAYANTLSWRNPTTPLPMENQPRAVFERLFGDTDDTSTNARLARIREDRSILDSLVHEVGSFRNSLAPSDRDKVNQYLDAIRDIERRIQLAERQADVELPELARPTGGIPDTFADHARLMFDLQVLALQTDMTRIITFMMSREVSPRTYPELGIPDPHHGLSHHQNNPAQMEKLAKVNLHHIEQFAYFVNRLANTPDGDSSLLDTMTMLYGCGISDGNQHLHVNLPVMLVGGANGRIKGGRHLKVADETPLTNLQLTLLDAVGVETDHLGDSTGQIEHLSV
ncbi:MAG: hypothetical protein CL483_02455 [Acidobacteria bacterium]|nr:hypothetical protein [Acidobacteriota bacterium]